MPSRVRLASRTIRTAAAVTAALVGGCAPATRSLEDFSDAIGVAGVECPLHGIQEFDFIGGRPVPHKQLHGIAGNIDAECFIRLDIDAAH